MIELKHISHSLGGKQVLNDVNLTLKEGGVMGLVGINGAGKSTLLRLISGVYVPDAGEALCDGVSLTDAEARKRLFFLPDDPYYTGSTTGKSLCSHAKINVGYNINIRIRIQSMLLQNILEHHLWHTTFSATKNIFTFQIRNFEIRFLRSGH